MSPRDAARAVSLARVGLGAGLVLAPRLAGRGWLGASEASRPATGVVLRAHGVRDAIIGAIALHTLDGAAGPRYLRVAAVCDVVDLCATLAARRALPALGVGSVAAMAAGAVAAQVWAARQLEASASASASEDSIG